MRDARGPRGGRRVLVGIAIGWAVLAGGALAIRSLSRDATAAPPPPVVRYDLDARLDAQAHVVHGEGTIAWRSDAREPVDTLRLHLYLNAFRDEKSAFLREAAGRHRSSRFDEKNPGSIEIEELRLDGGEDLLPTLAWVGCDGHPDDRSVAQVRLPKWVAPGEEVVVRAKWTSRLPRVFARTGFGGDFHMVAQWFPKLGVWEDAGEGGATVPGWNCHAFHVNSEFFADFGTYDVRLRVPSAYRGRVGATGERRAETENDDGTITYAFHADDVHDFAWVCGERFDVHVSRFAGGDGGWPQEAARVAKALGRTVSDLSLPPVRVTLLLLPEHARQRERHERAVHNALALMGLWYGPYPYRELTVVDPDGRAQGAGGMEYPTLITGGTAACVAERGHTPEGVLVHEFGHQHFYGLLASNEFEDAWMDEGMTTYATAKVLAKAYRAAPEVSRVFGFPWYREAPLEFPGVQASLAAQVPGLCESWLPFGNVGIVRQASEAVGISPPDRLSPWPSFGEPSLLRFVRDAAPLTHLGPLERSVAERERVRYAEAADVDAMAGRKAWEYLDRASYGRNSYRRAASMLRTLEGLLGDDDMTVAMRTYAERFRWRHPTPDDFFDTFVEFARERRPDLDLRAFFDECVKGTGTIDFGVHEVTVEDPEPDGAIVSTVVVRRYGTARFPTTVRVAFEDGGSRTLRWGTDDRVTPADDGARSALPRPPFTVDVEPAASQYRWTRLRFRHHRPVVYAETDPMRTVGLELDRSNDGRRAKPDAAAARRLTVRTLGWTEMLTSFYGGL